jgi:hypothetical protein
MMKASVFSAIMIAFGPFVGVAYSGESHHSVADLVIAAQRAALAKASTDGGFGPQSPRDINSPAGNNQRAFGTAPERRAMNLCNIHFHENAEHRGGDFTTFAGNGDGHGYGTGFKYDGELTEEELAPLGRPVGKSEHGDLVPGDTIEIHFVHSSADVRPGATLGSCVSDSISNPQLRVETVVAVLVNDTSAASLMQMADVKQVDGIYQVPNLPENLGQPTSYVGSTTGPSFNDAPSPLQVTWNVRPKVIKLDINSVAAWLAGNPFKEAHAHGVRNLVINPDLLSPITP